MESVTVRRNVILRSVVTEKLRQELGNDLQNAADEITERLDAIDAQTRQYVTNLQQTDLQQAIALRKRIESEKQVHQEQRDTLLERKAQVAELEDGVEVVRGTLESYVDLKVGDNLSEVLGGIEIVTNDDEVIAIRKRDITAMPEESVVQLLDDAGPQPR